MATITFSSGLTSLRSTAALNPPEIPSILFTYYTRTTLLNIKYTLINFIIWIENAYSEGCVIQADKRVDQVGTGERIDMGRAERHVGIFPVNSPRFEVTNNFVIRTKYQLN